MNNENSEKTLENVQPQEQLPNSDVNPESKPISDEIVDSILQATSDLLKDFGEHAESKPRLGKGDQDLRFCTIELSNNNEHVTVVEPTEKFVGEYLWKNIVFFGIQGEKPAETFIVFNDNSIQRGSTEPISDLHINKDGSELIGEDEAAMLADRLVELADKLCGVKEELLLESPELKYLIPAQTSNSN